MQSAGYWLAVAGAAGLCGCLCAAARRRPGPWAVSAARLISVVLIADAVTFMSEPVVTGTWRLQTSLPLALCDVALVVAAGACWTRNALLV
jgi:uncharacterized membrane protein YwaF